MRLSFSPHPSTVFVQGDVDAHTAPLLGSLVASLLGSGHHQVTIDVGAVSFLGSAGLGVIAEAATLLRERSGTLTVSAPSPQILRIFQISGVADLVTIQSKAVTMDRPDPVDFASVAPTLATTSAALETALQLVTKLARATVAGADGVSVSMQRAGQLITVASSNETVRRMDAHQFETGEGPCVSAADGGKRIIVESLATERRWPDFVPLARGEGISSIMSTPLLGLRQSVGALNIYSNHEHVFGEEQQELAQLFAAQASGILVDAHLRTGPTTEPLIAEALVSRQAIARGQGILMERHGIDATEAVHRMHVAARTERVTVLSYANGIVSATLGRNEQTE